MIEPFYSLHRLTRSFQPKSNYVLMPGTSTALAIPRSRMVIFPDGCTAEDYGLTPIRRLADIDLLCRFEVIQYLEALTIAYNIMSSEMVLKKILKNAIAPELEY